jgi:hypothetical protein
LPGLIGLSPLTTGHPIVFQHYPVRASIRFYSNFTLPMARSPGFGSTPCYLSALFRLAFASAPTFTVLTLQHKVTRRLILQKACSHPHMGLLHFVGLRFQVLFHSPSGVLFHLSLTVLVRYRSSSVFSLTEWSPQIPTQFHVLDRTQVTEKRPALFAYRTFTVSGWTFQTIQLSTDFVTLRSISDCSNQSLQPPCYNGLSL